MSKTERLYIRIDPELKEKLQALANAENRTISNYVENLIAERVFEAEIKEIKTSFYEQFQKQRWKEVQEYWNSHPVRYRDGYDPEKIELIIRKILRKTAEPQNHD